MLPAPMVFPKDHCPVWAGIVVRLFAAPPLPGALESAAGAFDGVAEEAPLATGTAGETCELLRECPGFVDWRRVSRVDSVRFGGGAA